MSFVACIVKDWVIGLVMETEKFNKKTRGGKDEKITHGVNRKC